MLNLTEYRKTAKHLADQLVWFGFIDQNVILNKTGSMQRTCQLMGYDLETSSIAKLENSCNKLNHIFKQIGSGWSLYFDMVRSKTTPYPKSKFPDVVSGLLDLERKEIFEQEYCFFESKYYLTFVYLPPNDSEIKIASKFVENDPNNIGRKKDLDYFKKTTDSLMTALRGSFANVENLTDSEVLTYLHSIISNKDHKVNVPNPPVYLDYMLTDTPLLGGLEPKLGEKYFKVLTIRFLPNESWPCLLDGLNNLNIEFRWTSRWISLDKQEAVKQIEKKSRGWMSKRLSLFKIIGKMLNISSSSEADDPNASMNQEDAEAAKIELTGNHVGFGFYTATVIVYDSDLERCQNKLNHISSYINDQGFVCKVETINAKQAWFGSLPGHCHANVRYPLISTINFAHFLSISSAWAGHTYNNHFGKRFNTPEPLMITQTEGNTPFRLVLHQGDVGHTLLLGPTGKGKSTFLVMLALQFLRYPNAQVFFFDKGYSAKVATLAVNGTHYQFNRTTAESAVIMQPLRDINQPEEREWAENWLQSLMELQDLKITIQQKQELRAALASLASRKPKYRTLLNLKMSLQEKNKTMAMALDKFVTGGPYGYLLDGDTESLSTSSWLTFELESLMENAKDAIEPVITCLFHKLEKRFDGRPALLILDEAWTYLKNEVFVARIQKWLRELRKNEVSVIFASQSLTDAINTPLMSILLESCQTKIFLPNQEANNPEIQKLYLEMGLNSEQINIVANAIGKKQYFYYSSAGVRLFDLALGELAIAICCNSGKEVAKRVDEILAKYGKQQFISQWLKLKKIHWAYDLLQGDKSKELENVVV